MPPSLDRTSGPSLRVRLQDGFVGRARRILLLADGVTPQYGSSQEGRDRRGVRRVGGEQCCHDLLFGQRAGKA
jgi:hypothetical protein